MNIENDNVTYKEKIVGKVKSIKIIDDKTHYDIEITDKELIDKIKNAQQEQLSVGYSKINGRSKRSKIK